MADQNKYLVGIIERQEEVLSSISQVFPGKPFVIFCAAYRNFTKGVLYFESWLRNSGFRITDFVLPLNYHRGKVYFYQLLK